MTTLIVTLGLVVQGLGGAAPAESLRSDRLWPFPCRLVSEVGVAM